MSPDTAARKPDPFSRAMEFVLRYEGGYVDHPSDPGGATNLGISLRYARGKGRLLDLDRDGDVDAADIRLITRDVAADIYRRDFWAAVQADRLPPAVAVVAFDAAINCGPQRAAIWLQAAARVAQDGAIGPKTLAAVAAAPAATLVSEMLALRIMHHASLSTWSTFGLGWMRRVTALAVFAAEFLAPAPLPATSAS